MTEHRKFKLRLPPSIGKSSHAAATPTSLEEYPYKTISLATTHSNLTGLWRYWRPSFEPRRAPCDAYCPVGNQIVDFIQIALKGNTQEAAAILRLENPLPSVTARVCHRPCEIHCNRREYDRAIAIHTIEAVLAEIPASVLDFPPAVAPRKVAILGSGPAELSFAHFMARFGHSVTIFEPEANLGGKLRSGPQARLLPEDMLDAELQRLLTAGIIIRHEKKSPEELQANYAAAFGAFQDPRQLSLVILEDLQQDSTPAGAGTSENISLRISDAIGYGKWTAILLDASWRGLDPQEVNARTQVGGNPRILSAIKYYKVLTKGTIRLSEDIVTYDQLHLETWEPTPTDIIHKSSLIQDVPVRPWLEASHVEQALQEAGRCFSCGRCNECDTCWVFCPEGVISRSNGEYAVDYDYCKGCTLCAAVCPRRAIAITEEKK